ncbi:MAG: glucosyltransferase domain-containing protein, partial [Lachnospiraceae bacterium]|nr:glucosyltransferase domain-containing protein [Lachnospiraceae bacterium]
MMPKDLFEKLNGRLEKRHKAAFLGAVLLGLLIHLPVMLSDIPNHDGLASMYFDQNMITSGRWFLTVACGFSSYFTVPWVIGLIGLFFLGLASVVLTELLEIRNVGGAVVLSGMLVAFPALASTFAYVFTLDGYMMALFLAVTAVYLTKKYRLGFLYGAICLAFS